MTIRWIKKDYCLEDIYVRDIDYINFHVKKADEGKAYKYYVEGKTLMGQWEVFTGFDDKRAAHLHLQKILGI